MLAGRLCSDLAPQLRWFVGAALGYALIGSVVGLLGLMGHLYQPLVAAVPLIILLLRVPSVASLLRGIPDLLHGARSRWNGTTIVEKFAIISTAFAATTGAAAAALPAVWWDPIAYHLPIAARALRHGTFAFDPAMTQTGFPLLGEAAALPAYALAGSAGAAMATLGAGVVLALLAGVLAERWEPGAGKLATALTACSALWLWLAPSFYVDIPFAMFVVAAITLPLAGPPPKNVAAAGAVCGALAGAAAAVKYPGLADALVAATVMAWFWRRPRAVALAGFACGLVAVAGAWYVRVWLVTGDPVYPLLTTYLGSTEALRSFAARYVDMTRNWCGGGGTLVDALLVPWRLLTEPAPQQYCGDPGLALRVGIVFFAAAAAARRALPLIGLTTLLTALWFMEARQERFLVPAMCLYASAVAVGTAVLGDRLKAIGGVALAMLCLVGAALNWLPSGLPAASNSLVPGFRYARGVEDAAAYLRRRLETFAAAAWLQQRAARGQPILALDDVRDYYFGPYAVWGNPYYQPVWSVRWSASGERYLGFARAGIRYIVVNANAAYVRRTATGIDWGVLAADERRGELVRAFAANDVVVYRIRRIGASRVGLRPCFADRNKWASWRTMQRPPTRDKHGPKPVPSFH